MATKKKASQVRSADAEAVRATVYLPPDLHKEIVRITELARTDGSLGKAGSSRGRVTQSHTIIQACRAFVATKPKPRRKAVVI